MDCLFKWTQYVAISYRYLGERPSHGINLSVAVFVSEALS